MSYKIGEGDYDVRKKRADKFIKNGNRVKLSIQFRGGSSSTCRSATI